MLFDEAMFTDIQLEYTDVKTTLLQQMPILKDVIISFKIYWQIKNISFWKQRLRMLLLIYKRAHRLTSLQPEP